MFLCLLWFGNAQRTTTTSVKKWPYILSYICLQTGYNAIFSLI